MRRILILSLVFLLLCACTPSKEANTLTFPADFPQISFESYPLGMAAEQAAEELECEGNLLEELERYGSAIGDVSLEAFERGGGMVSLKGVPTDHVQFLFRDDAFESVSYFFYLDQFESREAFFSAVVEWHAVLSEVLAAAGYTQESLKLAGLRSGDDYEDNTRQATFWTNDTYQLQLTLTGVGNRTCCKATLLRNVGE